MNVKSCAIEMKTLEKEWTLCAALCRDCAVEATLVAKEVNETSLQLYRVAEICEKRGMIEHGYMLKEIQKEKY